MVFPSLRLSEIVRFQGGLLFGFLPKWGVFLQPLGFAVFFVAALAETKRVPFDLPEGESEIIGFFTEYGGLKWGLFMMTDFLEIIVVACLADDALLRRLAGPLARRRTASASPGAAAGRCRAWLVTVLEVVAFNVKVFFFCWLQILIRWTYPRFRYDQVMDLGWKLLVPAGRAQHRS